MDIEKIYEEFYQIWLREFKEKELSSLNEEIIKKYKNFNSELEDLEFPKEDTLKKELISTYKENLTFMYNEILKMREIKILNASLTQLELNTDHLTEAEKLFFQNLVSAIKGFKKVRDLTNLNELKNINKENQSFQFTNEMDMSEKTEINNEMERLNIKSAPLAPKKDLIDYTLIKFLKETPPLVGVDLINYGPFPKEDIAYIPSKNAKILIFEKFAEKIEIN